MSVLRSDGCRESGRKPFVFLAGLSYRATRHKILQLLIGSQAEHFLAAASCISRPKILVHDVEELLELELRTPGEDSNQLLSYQIGNPTGECIFL